MKRKTERYLDKQPKSRSDMEYRGKNFWMLVILAHGSGGGLLFWRQKSNQKTVGTYGFQTSLIHPGSVRQAKLGGSNRVKVFIR
jgi:hypothetical protein